MIGFILATIANIFWKFEEIEYWTALNLCDHVYAEAVQGLMWAFNTMIPCITSSGNHVDRVFRSRKLHVGQDIRLGTYYTQNVELSTNRKQIIDCLMILLHYQLQKYAVFPWILFSRSVKNFSKSCMICFTAR